MENNTNRKITQTENEGVSFYTPKDYSLLNDTEIKKFVKENNMIENFIDSQVTEISDNIKALSYGISSFGYDLRVGEHFKIFNYRHGVILDPKHFDESLCQNIYAEDNPWEKESYIILPPHSFALATSVEKINMPKDVLSLLLTKSSYARCGILLNSTMIQPNFSGDITIEITNSTPLPVKIYANEGIGNLLFLRANPPENVYNGKYQNQKGVTTVK